MEADAALAGTAGIVVLHTEALENLDPAVVHAHRDAEAELAQRAAQQITDALLQTDQVGDLVELGPRHLEGVEGRVLYHGEASIVKVV